MIRIDEQLERFSMSSMNWDAVYGLDGAFSRDICACTYVIDPLWSMLCGLRGTSWRARAQMLSSVRCLSTLLASNTQRQTIYALSTPPGKGGVAIVRVSGPDAKVVWDNMVRSHKPNKPIKDPIPWKLHRCHIVHPKNKSLIDDGLAVYFKGTLHLPLFFSKINTTTSSIFIYDVPDGWASHSLRKSFDLSFTILVVYIADPPTRRSRWIHAPSSLRRSTWPNSSRGLAWLDRSGHRSSESMGFGQRSGQLFLFSYINVFSKSKCYV